MQNENNTHINRILVSLDFDDYGASFVEPLVSLAAQLKADLCGLFIENSDLQQVADLPFSREITFPTAQIRQLNSDHISRHLKQQAETLRKMMREFSRLANVACSFRTAKGPRIDSVLSEAYDFQLVLLLPEKFAASKIKRPAQLDEIINPTVLFYDDSRQAKKTTHIIKSLANSGDLHQLKILTLDHASEISAKQQFSSTNIKIEFQHFGSYKLSNITSLIGGQKTGLLILPLEKELINQSKEIKKILDVLGCPLLLVR